MGWSNIRTGPGRPSVKDYSLENLVFLNDGRKTKVCHVRGKKKDSLSHMTHSGTSVENFRAELGKCEVVCANCHRLRTFSRKCSWCTPGSVCSYHKHATG